MATHPTKFDHKVHVNGHWRTFVAMWVHVNGHWRPVTYGWSRVEGAWRPWVTTHPEGGAPGGGTVVHPHPPTTVHIATTKATVIHGIASWHITAGRHVVSQVLTYYTGLSTAPHKHTIVVPPTHLHQAVIAQAWNASVRYRYT